MNVSGLDSKLKHILTAPSSWVANLRMMTCSNGYILYTPVTAGAPWLNSVARKYTGTKGVKS